MNTKLPILEQAAQFLSNLEYDHVPNEVVETSKRAILDYIGVAIPGSRQPVSENLFRWAGKRSWSSDATVIGREVRLDPENAALVNAASGHALDFDDTSWATIGHPTTVILPAILAIAEEHNFSGKRVLLAYIAGIEVTHKIADLMMPEASENGWHTTGIFYALGTAAAVCQLLQLDAEQTTQSLALSLSRSSGIRSNFGTQAKPYHAGMSAKAGLEAVTLTFDGVTSSPFALEGQDGFIQCFANACLAKKARNMVRPIMFGSGWDIANRGFAFKKYPNCSGNHPACDVLLELLSYREIPVEEIESIHCGVSLLGPKELVCHQPQSPVEARFSIQFALASALIFGRVTLEEFREEVILDPVVQSLMSRITMGVDDDLAKLGFIGTAPIKVWINLVSGEQIFLENNLARGNHEKPFSDEEFTNKFTESTKGILSEDQAATLINDLLQLDKVSSIRTVTSQLGR
ncbi:MmgE/PrpD family protein [Neptunomonas sp. XY-337]|uniref:MmgE/PrpD family protein n=1 Tax=Neptunomonas sp. XY-337 TaxID=2561897 RepID=UPI0010AA5ADA|nr:MmgE/PrpD family protein [Neptunomonas sp. XY-337]